MARSLRYKQTATTITEQLRSHVIDGYATWPHVCYCRYITCPGKPEYLVLRSICASCWLSTAFRKVLAQVIESQNRQLDTAVLEAFNVGDLNDGTFAPLSIEVVMTLKTLTRLFCRNYQVNQHAVTWMTQMI